MSNLERRHAICTEIQTLNNKLKMLKEELEGIEKQYTIAENEGHELYTCNGISYQVQKDVSYQGLSQKYIRDTLSANNYSQENVDELINCLLESRKMIVKYKIAEKNIKK